jgi:hypothetical protein
MLCVATIVDSRPSGYWRARGQRMKVVFSQRSGRGVSLPLHVAVVGAAAQMGPVWQSLPRARTAASTSSSNHQRVVSVIEVWSMDRGVCGGSRRGWCMFMYKDSECWRAWDGNMPACQVLEVWR